MRNYLNGGHNASGWIWLISILLVLMVIIAVYMTIQANHAYNLKLLSQASKLYRQQQKCPGLMEHFGPCDMYAEETTTEEMETDYDKLVNDVGKWLIEGKRKLNQNNAKPSSQLMGLMNNVSKYIEAHATPRINVNRETDIINPRKNEILDLLNKNLDAYNGSKPDESGKYSYTVNNKMYTYKDDHNSAQTVYNKDKKTYKTTSADNGVKLKYNENAKINPEDIKPKMSDETIKPVPKPEIADGVLDDKQLKGDIMYSSTYTEPEYNIVINNENFEEPNERFTNNPANIIEDHIVNILKIIHDKYT